MCVLNTQVQFAMSEIHAMCDGLECQATQTNSSRLTAMPLHSEVNCQWKLGKECLTEYVSKYPCFPGKRERRTCSTLLGLIRVVFKALNYLASDSWADTQPEG